MIGRYEKVLLRFGPVAAAVLLAAALLSGCGVHGLHMAQSPLLKIFAGRSGHIAYVGNDGNIYLADQAGSITALTKDAGDTNGSHVTYVSPTWSPQGGQLAYARYVTNPSSGTSTVQFEVLDWKTKNIVVTLHSDKLKPFYFDWSPDARHVALLSDSGGNKLELGVVTANRSSSYVRIDGGSPYYWTWSSDGSTLISHTDFTSTFGGRVSIIPVADPASAVNLTGTYGLFQAPAVLRNGDILAVEKTNDSVQMAMINPKTKASTPFAPSGTGGFLFSVSPNGKMIAYVDAEDVKGKPSSVLHIWDVSEHKTIRTIPKKPTIGFYWSPNSAMIAFYTPALGATKVDSAYAQIGSLPHVTLEVLDVSSGDSWQIATFPLTQGLLSTLPYTDQYQRSQTIWSPNSRYLLFTAYTNKGVPGVFVADANGNIKPSAVAAGDSAVWSWK